MHDLVQQSSLVPLCLFLILASLSTMFFFSHPSPQGDQSIPGGTVHWPRVLPGKGDPPTPGSHVQGQHRLRVKPKGNASSHKSQMSVLIEGWTVPLMADGALKAFWEIETFGWISLTSKNHNIEKPVLLIETCSTQLALALCKVALCVHMLMHL